MVNSQKTKSKHKRVSMKKKSKILKKVKLHCEKKAKEARKIVHYKAKPKERDAEVLEDAQVAAMEARRAKAIENYEQNQAAKRERAAAKRKMGSAGDAGDVEFAQLANNASRKTSEFDKVKKQKSDRVGTQEHSRRQFYKEFMKVVEASDVIIQVLDARDPLGSRCLDVERMVHKAGGLKRIVLLLNKIDLVPREVAEKWLKYLREELPTVAFKCNTQQQRTNLGRKSFTNATENANALQSSDALGAETLLQLLKNYSRNQKMKTAITVGVVGFPNVGKSSLINSLKRTRVASVGATPGVTKAMQEIHLDKHVKLLDCPGIVFAASGDNEASATLRNCTRIEQLDDPATPVKEILRLCPAEKLKTIYNINSFSNVDEFLMNVAMARGKLKKGGVVDSPAAARIVLHDWNEGKIPYFTTPPVREVSEHAEFGTIVSDWGKEFDVEAVFQNEASAVIAGLPSIADSSHVQMSSSAPLNMDVDDSLINQAMEEEDSDEEEEEEDEMDAGPSMMDTNEVVVKRGRAYLSQNERLYDAEGIQNPHAKRALKKKMKKAAKNGPFPTSNGNASDDYNFETDYIEDGITGDQEGDGEDAMEGVN
ncbi:guanine nucleotide-binding protein-like NSN1 [Physcomitrium patens]|uniref:CP-type G domain-containing protein n=1 Tax=Physcomitrium patens TaxID=3218 RepID=A0A2K1J6N8_PHYPA|nr:guanine nucleotide-binding protein-like NSN1 [Physcomitrium patens]PNR37187.1 hypothetical protein PHYPA_020294 [Physcomitrium patens]|eukprot:XP_024397885.1 guanine nucleotide-binding protein-like NSN1 [Physcomitrella patens]